MRQRKLVGLCAGAAVVVAGTAVVTLNWPADPTPQALTVEPTVDAPAAVVEPVVRNGTGKPVAASLHTLNIRPADARARSVDVPKHGTQRFSLLGITWTDPDLAVGGTVQVRTRAIATGRWSGWQTLETEGTLGPDGGAEAQGELRGSSEPLWVGPSDGVAARVVDAGGTRPLPAGLRLDLIDPDSAKPTGGQGGGVELAPSDPPSAAPLSSASASASASASVALPSYTSRSGWGADESLVTGTPAIGTTVKVVFVHHTADSAGTADCAGSAAHVRAILAYHVKSRGWLDIGYNFLVDQCGTLFEGRKGGVGKAVVGAHTYGFNSDSAGIVVLGTYTKDGISAAARKTISQVAAAKLTQYGFDPATTGKLTEHATDGKFPVNTVVTFNRIAGHRDGVNTVCPGDGLYAQLPAIRIEASSKVLALKAPAPTGGVSANGKYYVPGKATMSWSTATPSAMLTKFEMLVDGVAAATLAGTARAGQVVVPSGTHKLQVRAVHVSGNAETTPAATVVSDVTAPVVSAPWLGLRGGTVTTTAVPLTVNFKASDNTKVTWVGGTTPSSAKLPTTATTWSTSAKPGGAVTFTIAAKDLVGNAGRAAAIRTTSLRPETAAKRTGTWTTKKVASHLNGKALYSTKKNAKLTFTFTGRSAALIVSRTKKSGKLDVYVDGKKVSTIDTKSSKTAYRQAIWTRSMAAGKHTVTVLVRATSGRPGVTVDGLAYIQ